MNQAREKLEAIKIKHLPKGSDAWSTCSDKTLMEITRAKLLRFLLQTDECSKQLPDHSPLLPDPDDCEDAILYLTELLERYNPPPPVWQPPLQPYPFSEPYPNTPYCNTTSRLSLGQK